jgi:protoheme IX farnesyltransferase
MATDLLAVDEGWKESCSVSVPATNRTSEGPIEVVNSLPQDFGRVHRALDYVQLTKPRIVTMIVVVTVSTALIGAGGSLDLALLFWLLLGTALVAASAGAANQVWERVIDGRMSRTARRPLPSRRLDLMSAIAFTAILGAVGIAILFAVASFVPAFLGLATWLLYVLAYTPLKTRTSWNTSVGAVAGALPMLIGYTGAGGSIMDATGWLLVGVLAAWQYPHFMAIAWICRQQYADAGFRMSTTVDSSGRSAGIQSIVGSLALIICAVALCWIPLGRTGAVVGTAAVLASNWPLLRSSLQFAHHPSDLAARRLLRKSLVVLPIVLAIVTVRMIW